MLLLQNFHLEVKEFIFFITIQFWFRICRSAASARVSMLGAVDTNPPRSNRSLSSDLYPDLAASTREARNARLRMFGRKSHEDTNTVVLPASGL